jgi:hypothetical protein
MVGRSELKKWEGQAGSGVNTMELEEMVGAESHSDTMLRYQE